MKNSHYIKDIQQCDNHSFSVEWSDGLMRRYRLSDLQRCCPCAKCTDEFTGKPLVDPKSINQDVRAIKIKSVGKYGLQIQFTEGCSMGIYSFEHLRNMEEIK